MTPQQALDALASLTPAGARRNGKATAREALNVLRELVDGAPEVVCPACSATIRARMADA